MERVVVPSSIKILGIDADDTLWQNEEFFRLTQDRFADMLAVYMPPEPLHEQLLATERRNLGRYGYGIKGFMLSMVETAIDECERFYPVFQFVLWGGKSPAEAISASLIETRGEA